MKRNLYFIIIILLLGSALWAEDSDGPIKGSNLLRNDRNITTYRESEKGIPLYVEGTLMAEKARGNEVDIALSYFEKNKGAYKMASPTDELTVKRVEEDILGMRHVRFDQKYLDVPVIGGNMIAHFSSSGILKTVNGYYYHDIDIDVSPSVSPDDAVGTASGHLKSFFGEADPDRPQLVIFPWEGVYYLSWRLFLYSDTPMGRWEYLVDARSGEVIFSANRIMDADDIGTGYGVMGGTRDHIDTDYTGSTYQMRDYTRQLNNNPHGHNGQMPDGRYIQTNIAGGSLPGSIATDADNFWDDAATQRPAVDGQVYTGLFYDWMLAEMGRNGFDDNGANMLTSVNYYAEGDNNAYWNGSQIVIWSWSSGWRSLAGCPDVIAHEWGHAVTDYCSDLVYQLEPGALNESFSDMLGAAFEWAHPAYDTPDWDMGENGRTTGVGFRDMENPHNAGDPDTYGTSDPYWIDVVGCTPSYYNDYCGVHTNSGVGNKWFVLLSDGGVHNSVTVTGIGVDNAILIAYRANAYYWNANTDYHQAALGTISAADDLDPTGAWSIQVGNAWNAVNVSTPGPSLVFGYPDDIPSVLVPDQDKTFEVLITGSLGGTLVSGSAQIHYSLDGGAYVSDLLTEVTLTRFNATLPGIECGSQYEYYISAEETTSGIIYDPDPSSPNVALAVDSQIVIFEDDFETDKGWTVSGDATDGQWNRGVPAGLGERGDPPTDFDGSGSCYLTDNVYGNSDVDGGTTNLDSPIFDLSGGDARIEYARWFSNDWGDSPYTDTMKVFISNNGGSNWTLAETVGPVNQAGGGWYEYSFYAGSFVTLTDQMKVRFAASDLGSGSVVEAAVDAFRVVSYSCGSEPQPLEITTETLPDWTSGYPYYEQLTATGGVGAKVWLDKYDDLIGTGLSLSVDGVLSGTPLGGPVSFTAEVTDENSDTDEQLYSFTINASVSIVTASLPDWTVGFAYSQQLDASGGTGAKTWIDKNSDLSGTGLTLSSSGLVSGTPASAGPVSFTAEVTDGIGASDEALLSFTINTAVSITTSALPEGELGNPYSQVMESSGGTGPKTWTDRDGDLAGTGLALASDGTLSGTPLAIGEISFTARVEDGVGSSDEEPFTFQVVRGYVCGDANGDEELNIADGVFTINHVFKGGPAPDPVEAGDANCDGDYNVGDAVYMINFVFKQGPAPCCP
jgi:bacillolysin/thermolysin